MEKGAGALMIAGDEFEEEVGQGVEAVVGEDEEEEEKEGVIGKKDMMVKELPGSDSQAGGGTQG